MEHIKHLSLGWLVMAAALLFAGCSSEDGVIAEEPKTIEPQATVIHVTVGAGISDGEATTRSTVDYTGGTRTLQFTSGDRLYVWGSYGSMESEPSGAQYYEYIVAGYLALDTESFDASDPTNATFTGDLTVYQWVNEEGSGEGADYFPEIKGYYTSASSSPSFSTADPLAGFDDVTGTLIHEDAAEYVDYFISEDDRMVYYWLDCAATVEELMTTQLWVSGLYDSGTKSFALTKDTDQPIVNCTISGLEAGVSYKVDYIYGTTAAMSDHSRMLNSSMTATGGTLAFAFIAQTGDKFHGIRLTNTADAGDTYTVSIGQKEFASKVYNLSRRFVNLASVTTETDGHGYEYFAAKNGDVLSGDFSSNNGYGYVTIPDGAKVTLNGVTFINGSIHCNGAATINLEGTNTIESEWDLGILIESGTLTIQGSGSLLAKGGAGTAGIGGYDIANLVIKSGNITAQGGEGGAGIGSGQAGGSCGDITIEGGTVVATGGEGGAGIGSGLAGGSCGDITITGGNVTATGGDNAAGIGSGQAGSSCGNITITGGNVTATGGDNAAGIGSGQDGTCGDITITNTVTSVTATSGGGYAQSIGAGAGDMCGTVTIGCTLDESGNPVDGEVFECGIDKNPYTYPPTE